MSAYKKCNFSAAKKKYEAKSQQQLFKKFTPFAGSLSITHISSKFVVLTQNTAMQHIMHLWASQALPLLLLHTQNNTTHSVDEKSHVFHVFRHFSAVNFTTYSEIILPMITFKRRHECFRLEKLFLKRIRDKESN